MSEIKLGDRVRVTRGRHAGETGTFFAGVFGELISFDGTPANSAWLQHANDPEPGKYGWYISKEQLEKIVPARVPSIADDLRLFPQDRTVLRHLKAGKKITPMKALTVYGITRLAGRIFNIRKAGYNVKRELRKDEGGQRYAVYSLAQ